MRILLFSLYPLLSIPNLMSNTPEPASGFRIEDLRQTHPRILAGEDDMERIRSGNWDQLGRDYLALLKESSYALLKEKPVTFEKRGLRILHLSRTVLHRITTWSLLYRITGDRAFVDRTLEEMDAVSAFPDWNPEHYLDGGEMTLALSIGLDWLWDNIPEEKREHYLDVLYEKGIKPSLDESSPYNWWISSDNNWNPVCHAGMIAGAILLADRDPELAERIIRRALGNLPRALDVTNPDGVYPEGPTYWNYGTHFTAIIITMLQHAFGTDYGLQDHQGFQNSLSLRQLNLAPTGDYYNFFDSGLKVKFSPVTAFFASTYKDPVAYHAFREELSAFLKNEEQLNSFNVGREFPMIALWYPFEEPERDSPLPFNFLGRGNNPIAYVREAFDDLDAFYLAYKGGRADLSHGHMDAGSFILEDAGVRWAIDLGVQEYISLESKGIGLWDRRQVGDRWYVYRIGPHSHNTLLIDNQHPRVDGQARITSFEEGDNTVSGVVDLTELFPHLVEQYERHFIAHDNTVLQITDKLSGLFTATTHVSPNNASLRWRMLTRADVDIQENQAVLSQDGKTFYLNIVHADTLGDFEFRTAPADPPNHWDEPNPGVQTIDIRLRGRDDGTRELTVLMSSNPDALARVEKGLK